MNQENNEEQADLLFISDNFPPVIGGSAAVYHQICYHNKDKVVALTSRYNSQSEDKKDADFYDRNCGFRIYRRDYLRAAHRPNGDNRLISQLLSIIDELTLMSRIMIQVAIICRRHRVKSICIGELIYGGWLVYFSKYILRKPVAIYTHGEEVSQKSDTMFARMRQRFLKTADRIFSVSLFCKSQIVSIFQIDPAKIKLVPNGVDLEKFSPKDKCQTLIQRLDLEEKLIVLGAGRHVERKGFDNLITSFSAVVEAIPNAHLLIIGDGPQTPILNEIANSSGIENHVNFLGRVDDKELVRYYQLADIFTMPNRTLEDGDTEGFGLVFLEANACGKPVVGGIGGGVIEAIINEKTGLNVDAADPRNIADALIRLLSDSALRRKMSDQGYEHARSASWQNCAAIFCNEIVDLCDIRKRTDNDTSLNPGQLLPARNKEGISPQSNFLVTVDFEESFDWSATSSSPKTVSGISEVILFHQKCRSRKVKPTYLLTYDVLSSTEALDFIKRAVDRNECEVGIHLHSWNTPPIFEEANEYNTFQCNLPTHLETAKLQNLIALFESTFGHPPVFHRAGRYGIDQATFDTLAALGVKIDLSPMSDFNFSHLGGPTFLGLANKPFWTGPDRSVFCLPLPSERFFKGPDWISVMMHRILRQGLRIADKRLRSSWRTPVRLTPEGNSLDRMKVITENLLADGQREIVLSLHSTSLYLGGNPYSSTPQGVADTFDNFEKFMDWCLDQHQMVSATPTTVLAQYQDG